MIAQGQMENPYKDVEAEEAQMAAKQGEFDAIEEELAHKSVILLKNHEAALPLASDALSGKKVYVASFTKAGEDEEAEAAWAALFEAAGCAIVSKAAEADIAFLDVVPGGIAQGSPYMHVLDLVEEQEVAEYDILTGEKTGNLIDVTTVEDIGKVPDIAEAVHANGGVVIGSINLSSPWILTNLEPYCDALIGDPGTSKAAMMDVITGTYNPTGKLFVTLVACNEVIGVVETEIDGAVYEICVSPNDVPGYDKDQYMSAEVLEKSPSGSYAYQDADGNVYRAWHGLSY